MVKPGTYTISLTVVDANGLVGVANETVTVKVTKSDATDLPVVDPPVIEPPVVDPTDKQLKAVPHVSPTYGAVPLTVVLSSRESIGKVSSEWEITGPDGEMPSIQGDTSTILKQVGSYNITLKITGEGDNDDRAKSIVVHVVPPPKITACFEVPIISTASDKIVITSETVDMIPSVILGNVSDNEPFFNVLFNAECSEEMSETQIAHYEWKLNGARKNEGKKFDIYFDNEGDYNITLKVSGNDNNESIVTKTGFQVGKLVAKAKSEPTWIFFSPEGTIQLDAIGSSEEPLTAPDVYSAEELQYEWTVKLNSSEENLGCENIEFKIDDKYAPKTEMYLSPAASPIGQSCAYTVTLKVTDPNQVTDEDSLVVKVEPLGPVADIAEPPIYTFDEAKLPTVELEGETFYSGTAPLTVQLDGSDSETTSGGVIEHYEWSYTCVGKNGETFSKVLPDEESGEIVTITFENPGKCVVELTVTDNSGLTSEPTNINIFAEKMLDFIFLTNGEELQDNIAFGDEFEAKLQANLTPATVAKFCGGDEEADLWGAIIFRPEAASALNVPEFLFFTETKGKVILNPIPEALVLDFKSKKVFDLFEPEVQLPAEIDLPAETRKNLKGYYSFYAALIRKGRDPATNFVPESFCAIPSYIQMCNDIEGLNQGVFFICEDVFLGK